MSDTVERIRWWSCNRVRRVDAAVTLNEGEGFHSSTRFMTAQVSSGPSASTFEVSAELLRIPCHKDQERTWRDLCIGAVPRWVVRIFAG